MDALDAFKYPIGEFTFPSSPLDAHARAACIDTIARTPAAMREAVAGLTDAELDTPYRPGGWTIRQVVHHVPDSHMHSYLRMKFALTEEAPLVKAYDEDRWSKLPDAQSAPVSLSLDLLDALHRRWVVFLQGLTEQDFLRTLVHPDHGQIALYQVLADYAWHGPHHVAHVRNATRGKVTNKQA